MENQSQKLNSGAQKKAQKKDRWSAWMREDRTPVTLCHGAAIDESVYAIQENRYFTLLIKGLIVYFFTAGGFGSYLTAMNVAFNQLLFHIVILATGILCAVLYHSWRSENLGYLVFFFVYAGYLILFRNYINSGFYAVLNDTIDYASFYFDTEGMQYYNERISNRYVAVTVAVIALGIAMNILLNNYILRRARYMVGIGLTVTINIFAFYMEREPDILYSLMLIAAIVMTFILKAGNHYWLSRNDDIFEKNKKGLSYSLDYKSLWQGMAFVLAMVIVFVAGANVFANKEVYDMRQTQNKYKMESKDTFQNFIMLGFLGIMNFYPNNGGMDSGKLGGVSTVRLDYQPDLEVEFTPYTTNRIYVRNFIGMTYTPYSNIWTQPKNFILPEAQNATDTDAYQAAYEAGEAGSAKGRMKVKNIAAELLPYKPYYTNDDSSLLSAGKDDTITYYPRLANSQVKIPSYEVDKRYLEVPKENQKVIADFSNEVGITKEDSPEVVVQKIEDYYQENIPYTIRPGATPWNADFVNNFLTKNKKGYCAHFASAATLVFRANGIPARYCEGYAIDFNEVTRSAELVDGANYRDYYDGENELGETALVRYQATDADAHAWVEIYVDGKGWTVADVTPASYGENDDASLSFWEAFSNIFGDGGGDAPDNFGDTDAGDFSLHVSDKIMKWISGLLLGLISLLALGFLYIKGRPALEYRRAFAKAGLSDKLILRYQREVAKRKKKDPAFRSKMNYREQVEYLQRIPANEMGETNRDCPKGLSLKDLSLESQRLVDILTRAGFSNKEISEEDYNFALETFLSLISNAYNEKK